MKLKQKDIPHFIHDHNVQTIITDTYIIQQAKIFYLFEEQQAPTDGVLDVQDLL